jgi:mRNA interferase RelE/StbE
MSYTVQIKSEVKKSLLSLERNLRRGISRRINELSGNPRPSGCKKLKGSDAYRIRVGDYRVVYEIRDDVLIVLVVRVAHRREVYEA